MQARNIGGLQQVKAASAVNNDNLCGKKKLPCQRIKLENCFFKDIRIWS